MTRNPRLVSQVGAGGTGSRPGRQFLLRLTLRPRVVRPLRPRVVKTLCLTLRPKLSNPYRNNREESTGVCLFSAIVGTRFYDSDQRVVGPVGQVGIALRRAGGERLPLNPRMAARSGNERTCGTSRPECADAAPSIEQLNKSPHYAIILEFLRLGLGGHWQPPARPWGAV